MSSHLSPKTAYALAGAGILLIAVGLRFFNLGSTNLWLDEAVYAVNSFDDFDTLMDRTRDSNSSPIALPFLIFVFGDLLRDSFWIRVLPALFSIASIVVLLLLPRVGAPRMTALIAAGVMAFLPAQIKYAQEVREYSLSVLATSVLVYAMLNLRNQPSHPRAAFLAAIVFLTPFLSYGSNFVSVVIVLLLGFSVYRGRISPWHFAVVAGSFGLGAFISYALTAQYQSEVRQADYLAAGFPPSSFTAYPQWLVERGAAYFRFLLGSQVIVPIFALLAGSYAIASGSELFRRNRAQLDDWIHRHTILVVLAILMVILIIAGILELYPFNGVRQQLFAAPLVALVFASSLMFAAQKISEWQSHRSSARLQLLTVAPVLSVLLLLSIPDLRQAYEEIEDIDGPVASIDSLPDESVYVYYGAVPAVRFHHHERNFVHGSALRGDIEQMAAEVTTLITGCQVALLFTHIHEDEDELLIGSLTSSGYEVDSDLEFKNARLTTLDRCPL